MIHRILYIDDNQEDHMIIKMIVSRITKNTCKVVACSTVDEGVDALKAQRFDVVLLDHKLDRQTGVSESLPILSRHLGDAKVIVVSDFIASID
ncbi:MAG: response regulator, partial [Devosiaceae bacterium]